METTGTATTQFNGWNGTISVGPSMPQIILNDLFSALSKAQAEMRNAEKDGKNPHFRSSYATLASVWDAAREPMSKNGLSIIQTLEEKENKIFVKTILGHTSGAYVESHCPVINPKGDMQGLGSAITYARRYALAAMVGVCPDDDDAEAATPRKPAPAKTDSLGDTRINFGPFAGSTFAGIKREDFAAYVAECEKKGATTEMAKIFLDKAKRFLAEK